jgi:hypothetical protein
MTEERTITLAEKQLQEYIQQAYAQGFAAGQAALVAQSQGIALPNAAGVRIYVRNDENGDD